MLRPTFIIIVLSLLTVLLYSPLDTGNFFSQSAQPRILLLTAHPDDECLFFAPTVLGLQRTSSLIFALSLSTGNADGLGHIRSTEFHRSYETLGVPEGQRWVLDHPNLQDNMTAAWNPRTISQEIMTFVMTNDIDTVGQNYAAFFHVIDAVFQILTFDYAGISLHPNHISLPYGVAHLIQTFYGLDRPAPQLYTLTTVPAFAKYTSILAPLVAKLDLLIVWVLTGLRGLMWEGNTVDETISLTQGSLNAGMSPVFISGIPEYIQGLRGMREHESQLVWFRWLYVIFSRYMWVNEWLQVQVQ